MAKLTDKQEAFCKEYLVDLNATKAAIHAGYSEHTAMEQGSRLLSYVKVHEKIASLKEKRSEKVEMKAEDVLRELKNWCLYDATEFFVGSMDEIKSLPIEVRRLITGFKQKKDRDGNETWELTFVSKERAMEMINRHIGFYEKDNKQKGNQFDPSQLTTEDLVQFMELQDKMRVND